MVEPAMMTVPNTYLGISPNKLPYIAIELEQKNTTLTAMNVHLQKELEKEHALAEALGHELEQVKAENEKLRKRITTQKKTIQAYRDESREWLGAARDFLGDINCDGCEYRHDCDDDNKMFCGCDLSYHAFQTIRKLMDEVE